MPEKVTAIFDIGKTNKKCLLFNQSYDVVWSRSEEIDEITDDDGDPCEDLERITAWVNHIFDEARSSERYDIQALNISTYGASLVHLDEEGEVVTPLYNYLKDYPEDLLEEFYATYGNRKNLSQETASPPMGMLNSGLQLYWLKYRKPELFRRISHTLHLPQYFSYLFTGEYHAELTSIGCHTALWNFDKHNYHHWVMAEQLDSLFPEIKPVTQTYDARDYKIGIGIHDSSAALAPFLMTLNEPFVLLSTGTWSVALNPFNDEPLTYEELEKDCLRYLNIEGKPVKAARFLLGGEYNWQHKKLVNHFDFEEDPHNIKPDPNLAQDIIQQPDDRRQLVLEKANATGPAHQDSQRNWDVSVFDSYEEGYHQLINDLVDIQCKALDLAIGNTHPQKIIVTGGFSQNRLFLQLLASRYPHKDICTTAISKAAALGAAMIVNDTFDREHREHILYNRLGLQVHQKLL